MDGGGFALFGESADSAQTQLQQTFLLPAGASTISFEFRLASAPDSTAGTSAIPDSFQVTLWDDATFSSSFAAVGPPLLPTFYSADNTGREFYEPGFVSVTSLSDGWKRVTLDVSSLSPQSRILEFILNGSDDGQASTASLDNVQGDTVARVVPAPAGLILLASGGPCLLVALRWRRRRPSSGP